VRTAADIERLPIPDPNVELRYVTDAVRMIRRELDGRVPLIGFAGSPWTVATYVVEGGSSKSYSHIKGMLYGAPRELHRLLDKLARATRLYLNAQIEAGAQVVMIFDTWGGVLTPAAYREFSLDYMRQIVEGLTLEREGRPSAVDLFTKGGGAWLADTAATGLRCARSRLDHRSCRCPASHERFASRCRGTWIRARCMRRPGKYARMSCACSKATARGHGHVFNLGHGIHPDVPPEHVQAMIEAVRELSPPYHP
jgi:uroporphyrinogen decarboxylase